jgi:hypothetical protein
MQAIASSPNAGDEAGALQVMQLCWKSTAAVIIATTKTPVVIYIGVILWPVII